MRSRSLPRTTPHDSSVTGIGVRFHRRNAIADATVGTAPRVQQFNDSADQSHQPFRIFFNRRLLAQLCPFFIVILHVRSFPRLATRRGTLAKVFHALSIILDGQWIARFVQYGFSVSGWVGDVKSGVLLNISSGIGKSLTRASGFSFVNLRVLRGYCFLDHEPRGARRFTKESPKRSA